MGQSPAPDSREAAALGFYSRRASLPGVISNGDLLGGDPLSTPQRGSGSGSSGSGGGGSISALKLRTAAISSEGEGLLSASSSPRCAGWARYRHHASARSPSV